jgi:hypothetical protein
MSPKFRELTRSFFQKMSEYPLITNIEPDPKTQAAVQAVLEDLFHQAMREVVIEVLKEQQRKGGPPYRT